LVEAVHDNLRSLGLETLNVVNFRIMGGHGHGANTSSVEAGFSALALGWIAEIVKGFGCRQA